MSDKILPITMPKWGLTMKEGTIVSWLKEVGDEIKKGDNLVEIETEKVDSCFSDVVASDDVSSSAPATPTFILPEKLEDAASATLARPIVETKADAINSSFFIITPFELMNIH